MNIKNLNKIIALFICLLAFGNLNAQIGIVNQKVAASSDSTVLNTIPLNRLSDEMALSFKKINAIQSGLIPITEFATFDSVFALRKYQINREKELLVLNEQQFTSREIDDAIQEWKAIGNKINKWIDLSNDQLIQVENQLFETGKMLQLWTLTREQLVKSEIDFNTKSSVSQIIFKIENLQKILKERQDDMLAKQVKLSNLLIEVNEVIDSLKKEEKLVQLDFFKQNRSPVWSKADSGTYTISTRMALQNSLSRHQRNFNFFYIAYHKRFILHFFIFILFIFGFYYLNKYSPDKSEIDEVHFQNSKEFLSSYMLTSFVYALLLSFWLYPIRQNAVNDFFQLTMLIISFFFLADRKKSSQAVLIMTIILFFINQIQVFLNGNYSVTRPALFIETAFAGWILYEFLKIKDFKAKTVIRNRWAFFITTIPVFLVFIAISFIANIFGFTNIALLLTGTVSNSIFNAILIVFLIRISRGTIIVLFQTDFAKKSNLIKNSGPEIESNVLKIIYFLAVLLWIKTILINLTIYSYFYDWVVGLFSRSWILAGNTIIIGRFFTFVFLIFITVYAIKFIKVILETEVFPRINLNRGIPGAISMLIGYTIAGMGGYIAFTAAGVDLSKFGLIAGALGVGIGFGLQGIVYNFIAGIILSFERPIQVGDTIEIGTMMGDVTSIGVRSSTVKTFDGSEVIVPNGNLISNNLINWTLSDRKKRYDIPVTVAYGSNPHQVLDLLRKIADENINVFKHPAPWALFDGFGDSALNFRIRIWLSVDTGLQTKSEVTTAIYDEFQKAGIEIPFPQQDLHVKSVSPSFQKLLFPEAENEVAKPVQKNKTKPKEE